MTAPMHRRTASTHSSGQILIIILLVMVVSLAVGLSVATRSLTNLRVSTQSEFSQRAFSAAEAGIEKALGQSSVTADNFKVNVAGSDITVNVSSAQVHSVETVIPNGGVLEIKLQGHTASNIRLMFGNNTPGSSELTTKPSIEFTVVDQLTPPSGVVSIPAGGKGAFNVPGSSYSNSFKTLSNGATSPSGKLYQAVTDITKAGEWIPIDANTQVVRIRAIYGPASVYIDDTTGVASPGIPVQADITTSKAQVPIGEEGGQSNLTRAVQVVKTKPALPSIFDYVLFGANGIVKQ